jgi:hypothetical protein
MKFLIYKKSICERFYNYFMKIYTYGSKTNQAWILFNLIFILIGSITFIFIGYFLINYIYLITEMYKYYRKE